MLQEYSDEYERVRRSLAVRLKEGPIGTEEVRRLEKSLGELEANRRQVEQSLRLDPPDATQKERWDKRLGEWSHDIRKLKRKLEQARAVAQRQCLALEVSTARSSNRTSGSSSRTSDFQRQVSNPLSLSSSSSRTVRMEDDLHRVESARKQLEQTDDISRSILSELHLQRETLKRTRTNMSRVSEELTSARQTVDRLLLRALRNRMVTYAVACFFSTGMLVYELSYFGYNLEVTIVMAVLCFLSCASLYFIQRRKDQRARLDDQALAEAG